MLAEFNSSDAIGSAMEESMKSANSWEGSLNKVSDSWYKLVNGFMDSDDAVSVLNSINVIIQKIAEDSTVGALGGVTDALVGIFDVLSKIIDKVGIIPTTIATIGTVQAFKGNSIFGNIVDISKNSEKSIKNLVTAFKELKTAKSTLESFNIDLSGFTSNDLSTLQEYIDLMDKSADKSTAFNQVLFDSSKNLQEQADKFSTLRQAYIDGKISQEEYTAATRNLAATQRLATGTSKALSTALNLIGNIAFTVAVSFIVSGIESLVTAEERAIQESEDHIQKIQESIENCKKEEEFLDGIIDKYTQLYMSTDDVTSIKKDLSAIQDELIQKYGEEANEIDLINQKYSENIKLAREKRKEIAEDFLRDEEMNIREAKNRDNEIDSAIYSATVNIEDDETLSQYQDYIKKYDGLEQYIEDDKYAIFHLEVDGLEAQIAYLEMQADIMAKNKSTSKEIYNDTIEELKRLREIRDNDKDLLEKAEYYQSILDAEPTKEYDKALDELINKQKEYEQLVSDNGSKHEIQTAQNDVLELKNAALKYAGASTELRQEVLDVVNAADVPVASDKDTVNNLLADIKEFVGGDFDSSLENIDKIKSAMQKLANGEMLEWDEVSTLLFDIDTDKILGDFEEIDGKYRMINGDMSTMIALKDSILKKQIEEINNTKTEHKATLEQLKAELELNKARLSRSQSSTDAEYFKGKISGIESEIEDVNNLIRDDNILIRHLNSQLGDTVDHTEAWKNQQEKLNEELEKAQNAADNYAKAMASKIDSIIESHESEKDLLESERDTLNEQLDALEEQQSALEEIIDQHKSLVDIVKDVTDKEIDLLKEQQKVQESAIDDKIKALEDTRDKQNEENELLEKEIALQEKLRDLEKSRQTKVRTYSESRGWHFDVDKEAVANAQTAANEAQKEYDKAVKDKAFNEQVDALEKEKELIAENFEAQIKDYEDYYKQWSEIVEEQTKAENEQLAQQILGVEWREKIKKKDTDILNKFGSSFRDYNSQLSRLVNAEIASLKTSIKAKEEEIKAKDEQIQSWQNYKTQVEKSINEIKGQYDEYVEYLGSIALSENSTYEDRKNALGDFVSHYSSCISQIQELQNTLGDLSTTITVDVDTYSARNQMADFMETYKDGVVGMHKMLRASSTGYGVVNSAWDAQLADAANLMDEWGMNIDEVIARLRGYSTGGVGDYTGIAMLHGTKQKSETIFNAQQSKELFDMVKTGSFSSLVAQRAVEGLTKSLDTPKTTSNFNNSRNTNSVVVQRMEIKADNPLQFHEQFKKEIDQYMKIELSESMVR